ncbi:hypothetical protein ONA91_31750 [Micromonospora sp. DR5-3]|nr:hypothetical protein [Micromonospora sp. DR5-3]MCW3819022.1 hypothetical protein [Micromonospora sp. DR5-3]
MKNLHRLLRGPNEEAMRRLRHPFAVEQVRPTAGRNPELRD